jgi:hypothetical protein
MSDRSRNITIENSHLYDLGKPRSGYAVYTHGENFTFRNNIVNDTTKGVQFYSSSGNPSRGLTIENNLFFDVGNEPYYHMSSSDLKTNAQVLVITNGSGARIVNNIIRDSNICLDAGMSNMLIAHNLIYNCKRGILVNEANIEIYNNVLGRVDSGGAINGANSTTIIEGNVINTSVVMVDPLDPRRGLTFSEEVMNKGISLPRVTHDMLRRIRHTVNPDSGPLELK